MAAAVALRIASGAGHPPLTTASWCVRLPQAQRPCTHTCTHTYTHIHTHTSAHLKVILETGELVTLDNVRKASYLAMLAGADFIKTSTGKVTPAATAPVVLVMLEAVRDFYELSQVRIGVKPAGGIRTTKDAIKQLVLVKEIAESP